jgi:hypothetical protein
MPLGDRDLHVVPKFGHKDLGFVLWERFEPSDERLNPFLLSFERRSVQRFWHTTHKALGFSWVQKQMCAIASSRKQWLKNFPSLRHRLKTPF